MTAHLRIERLVIEGLTPDRPIGVLRGDIERALAGLLTSAAVEYLRSNPPVRLPPIVLGATPPGRSVGMHVAMAIHDALEGFSPDWKLRVSTVQVHGGTELSVPAYPDEAPR